MVFGSSGIEVSCVFVVFGHTGFKGKQKEIVEAAFTGMPFFEIVFLG